MVQVNFYELKSILDNMLVFAVVCTKHNNKWIWCKNKVRCSWEIPGGKREVGEKIEQTARRELFEETGAAEFELTAVCEYSVTKNGITTFARLFFAEVKSFTKIPANSEISEISGFSEVPQDLSFPQIQPLLLNNILQWEVLQKTPQNQANVI